MLNEDALLLFAATGACALLILGVLDLVTPTRARPPRRKAAPGRDPGRRAHAGQLPTRQGGTFVAREAAASTPVDIEPPIERLLLSEAATLAPPSPPVRGPVASPLPPPRQPAASPLPPPREPAGSTFAGRRPASAGQGALVHGAPPPAAFSLASSSPRASSAPAPAAPKSTTADPSPTETTSFTRPGSLELWDTPAPSSGSTSPTVDSSRSESAAVRQPPSKLG